MGQGRGLTIATVATLPLGPETLDTQLLEEEASAIIHDFDGRTEVADGREEEGAVEERIAVVDDESLLAGDAGHTALVVGSERLQ